MTSDIEELRRTLEADPSNEPLKQKLIQAYIRENRRDEARDLVKGQFRCPLEWDELVETEADSVRHCEECKKQVFFVWTLPQVHELVTQNQCISGPQSLIDHYAEAVLDGAPKTGPDKKTPCVFESQLPVIDDLESIDIDESLSHIISFDWHIAHQVLPFAIEDRVLNVATYTPLPQSSLQAIKANFTDIDNVKQFLVNREQLTQVINRINPVETSFMGMVLPEEEFDKGDNEIEEFE